MNAAKDITQVSLGSNNAAGAGSVESGRGGRALVLLADRAGGGSAKHRRHLHQSRCAATYPAWSEMFTAFVYTMQSVIDAKPQAIAAYVRAINKAEVFIQNEPTLTKKLLNGYLGLGQDVTDAVYCGSDRGRRARSTDQPVGVQRRGPISTSRPVWSA